MENAHSSTYCYKQKCIIEERGEYLAQLMRSRPSLARVRDLSILLIHKSEIAYATISQHSTNFIEISYMAINADMYVTSLAAIEKDCDCQWREERRLDRLKEYRKQKRESETQEDADIRCSKK